MNSVKGLPGAVCWVYAIAKSIFSDSEVPSVPIEELLTSITFFPLIHSLARLKHHEREDVRRAATETYDFLAPFQR